MFLIEEKYGMNATRFSGNKRETSNKHRQGEDVYCGHFPYYYNIILGNFTKTWS